MYKFTLILLLLVSLPIAAQSNSTTQAAAESRPDKGFLSYIDFGGSSNSDGRVFTLGFSAGYQFNRHVMVSTRVPIFFASASSTGGSASGATANQQSTLSSNGIGDPSVSVELSFPRRILNYQTRLTTWIPVADVGTGFSTGDVLVDWGNRFSHPFGRLIPFGQVDIGNTVPDTPVFILPYTARGINTRLEGGANVELTKIFTAGASVYGVLPSGEQHVYSRMVMGGGPASATGGTNGMGGTGAMVAANGATNGFMMNPVTVGNDLTRDHGFSTWLTASLSNYVDMQFAYTRSDGYGLNTISFGVGFNIAEALRHHLSTE